MRPYYFFLALAALATPLHLAADNWMSRLPDDAFVATVSIPGTHDSATGSGWTSAITNLNASKYSETQSTTIEEQWQLGIRAFDLRPAEQSGYMSCNHGIQVTKLKFEEVLTQLCGYLDSNPTEFVVIHLLKGTGDNYDSRVKAVLESDAYQSHFVDFRRDLTVGQMRGKILVLSRDWYADQPSTGGFLGNWQEENSLADMNGYIRPKSGQADARLIMQDLANTTPTGALERKLQLMTQLMDWSTQHQTATADDIAWVFNFASAYDKTTSLLGNELSLSEGYLDNAKHTNKLVRDYLADHAGPVGLVMMDYVGRGDTYGNDAVQAVIENNFKPRTLLYIKQAELHWLHRGTPSLADYNNDGRMDIYYGGEQYDWQVRGMLYTQQADGTFAEESSTVGNTATHGLPPTVYGYQRWADIDNDGCLDFIATTRSDNDLQGGDQTLVFRNGGPSADYRFTQLTGQPFLNGYNEHADGFNAVNNASLALADYDGDGFVDAVQQAWTDGRHTTLLHNQGDGTFTVARELKAMTHGSVSFGDLDGDGRPDIVVTGWSDDLGCDFYIYRNLGDGTFEEIHATDLGFTGLCNSDVCLADLDGDGRLDIVAAGNNDGARTDIYINQGDLAFRHLTTADHRIDGIDEATIRVFDINYDGRPDIVFTGQAATQLSSSENASGQGTRIYLQDDDQQHFTLMATTGLPVFGQGGLALGDLYGRGTMDAVVVGNDVAATYQLQQAPASRPSAPVALQATGTPDGTITATWKAPAVDAPLSLCYNVYVRNNATGAISMLLPADTGTGRLKTIPAPQVAVRGTLAYTLTGLQPGTYTIGVQTIDPALQTSQFTTTTVSVERLEVAALNAATRVATLTGVLNSINFASVDDGTATAYDLTAVTISGTLTIEATNPNTIFVVSDAQRQQLAQTPNLLVGTKLYNAIFTDAYDVNTSFTGLTTSGTPKYVRHLQGASYATMLLPFKLSATNFSKSLTAQGIRAYKLGAQREQQGDVVLSFEEQTETVAATPYLLAIGDEATVGETVTITGASGAKLSFQPVTVATEGYTMVGTFTRCDDLTDCYVLPANSDDLTLRRCGNSAYVPAFHAYLRAEATSGARVSIETGDETTGVNRLTLNPQISTLKSQTLFDLQGRPAGSAPLRKGIYVRNGKKNVY